ncbi:hypothetical protein GLOIN_2v1790436 [Rhizophagus irregularis DAOM 181602=DAOM 197198]|uniref:Uncharacterized protein n=1 Tax=Rhizophagus irregularis (strain DAOM 181602 / DAOM 197198 / MUCL 43194) TaxID=747089 RepID=A0A2P4NZ82_RHIID|nr:hypothetical protein GLOIN_2v1790436 [Rhizophagus irregularis DAOM 181602=DAOM 197198]POG58408.1 hypothetical protein GLOIN_2v1790436 [Rhizophagus irregularis DAOM 181602=DAOM 197198]|eukprot:XP_025165274.1 hypothetical protein GLOIN_2v1790436 [Rhizophagus irregularis DAOM 181602=DAOM 197198]
MSHKKCNESVSPSPSSKRNKRNSSFDSPSPGRKKTPDIDDKRRSRHSSETRGKSSGRIKEKRSRDSSTDSRDERRGRSCTRKGNRSCNKRSNRSYSRDHKRKSVREELSEINSKLDHLVEEVLIIKKAQLGNNTATTNQYESVSPKQTFLMQHAAIDEEQCKSFRKKERRKQGLQYMYTTKSPTFVHLRPDSLTVEKYEKDLEEIVDNKAYHSDEISETDEEMAMKEINELVRPKNKLDKHVKKLLQIADSVGESLQHTKV